MNANQPRIFFAEDDLDDRELFQAMLIKNGVQEPAVFRDNGETALDYLKTCELLPDLVFLDINIPRKNGLTVLREMQEDARLASIPVVVFSTSNNPLSVQQAHLLGACLYAYKPLHPDAYQSLIRKILERLEQGMAARGPMSQFIIG